MRLPRPVMIGLAVLLLALLTVVGCRVLKKDEPKDPYRTAAVDQGAITRSVSASGTLEALVTVEVGSQISGQIRQVLVDFNDEVKAGQTLAILDPQTYESRVAQGQADIAAGAAAVRQAQAQAANAQADYNRKKILVEKGFYAPSVLDQSQATYRAAAASVEATRARVGQSQAALRSTRVDLSRTMVVAPIDGVIVDRQIEPGQTVAASLSAPVLFRIAQDLSKVQVKISVDEADIGQVKEGQAVKFTVDAFPDDNFTGIVTQVRKQPVTDQNVVAYTVMAEADNPRGNLLPGMTANADIVIEQKAGVMKVPAAALRWQPASANAQAARPAGGFGPPGMGGGFGGGQRAQGGGGQRGGMGAARLVQQLDLDAAQQKAWAPIEADLRTKTAAAFASAGGDRSAMRETMRKNTEAAMARLEPLLRPDQKQKLAVLRATMAQGRGAGGMTGGVVYVLRDDKPVPVPVRVGVTDGSFTEIRSPSLKAGDQVITGGGPKPKVKAASPFAGGAPGAAGGSGRPRT
ncbi:efflux RND transporter periplasmic adaptor subunit [Phenylobacterium sp.]|uniref:efflux RND transporter periplasmic adaptor subunit n=1 Tax=Phenylobacterium sp. TaxID=1871053 RepID=UPI00271D8B08|nr:efflux RND transporter periplasmic adaptor subunit [Phenylobacterium sp.]MDO8377883.1 efflux RND transporter periplasmic adaptor subunit [Phenylobacterium sp.]